MIAGQANAPLSDPISVRVDGRLTSFVDVVAAPSGGISESGIYEWPNLRPGSYLYHSGSHVQLQVHMGLYGAMVQDAAGCTGGVACAYSDVAYDAQQVLVFSEIDPALHDPMPKPANATVDGYRPQFFLINGEPFDGTAPAAAAAPGDDVLLRLLNAGLENRTIQLMGGHVEVLGEDGHRAKRVMKRYNVLLPAAKSIDALLGSADAGTYSLFDRRLKLVNGPVHGGGMFHQIVIE